MAKVDLTPAKLAELKQKAEAAADSPWTVDGLEVVRLRPSDFDDPTDEVYQVASCEWRRNAEHIAAADPATVLAMVEEIERLRTGLKPACSHWPISEDGHEWVRGCTLQEYQIPDGGEPSEFCPDCGGSIEIEEFQPNNESEAGQ